MCFFFGGGFWGEGMGRVGLMRAGGGGGRAQFDGADYEFAGFSVYGFGGVVGGRQGDFSR